MHIEVSSDMGIHKVVIGPCLSADEYSCGRKQCVEICMVGFWDNDILFPSHRVNYAEIIKDKE